MNAESMSVQQAAEKWNLSVRRVQDLCSQGKVPGAAVFGKSWVIPKDAPKPSDGRRKKNTEDTEDKAEDYVMPRKSPALCMTNLYQAVGDAERVSGQLAAKPEIRALFDAEIAHFRGQSEKVYEYVRASGNKSMDFYAMTDLGMMEIYSAIWNGDFQLWEDAKHYVSKIACKSEEEREILSLVLTAADSSVFEYNTYPAWFEMGNFEMLPADAHPMAKVFYARYLYMAGCAVAYGHITVEGVQGLALMRMIPNTLEPMISQAVVDKTLIAEIQLRLWCAAVYHNSGNSERAIYHIDKALDLALPDRFYGILAEHWRQMDQLLENRMLLKDPAAAKETKELYRKFLSGHSRLSGTVRQRNIATNLSAREREIAKLAAFGFTNKEIAGKLEISVFTVKSTIQNIMQKTNLKNREDFALVL